MVTVSLQVKNDMYYAVLSYKEGRKWKQKWKSTRIKNKKGNKKLAEEKARTIKMDFEAERKQKENNDNLEKTSNDPMQKRIEEYKNETFIDYVEESLNENKNNLAITTYESRMYSFNSRIKNFFTPYDKLEYIKDENVKRRIKYKDYLKISEITQFDIEDFYQWLYDCNLKGATVKKYHNIFSIVFKRAIRQKIFTEETNPMKDIKKPIEKPYIGEFYTANELKQVFNEAENTVLEIPILLASHYALRRAEVLGIKWKAIDFDNNVIIIKHTVDKVKGIGENQVICCKDLPKTKSGYRAMPLSEEMKKKLLEHKKKIEENEKLLGKSYVQLTKEYVCVRENGELIKPNYFTQSFMKLIRKNHTKRIRLHDLRHSTASLLAMKNVNQKLIQDFLGHANISSSNRYMHLDSESKKYSSNIIEAELSI